MSRSWSIVQVWSYFDTRGPFVPIRYRRFKLWARLQLASEFGNGRAIWRPTASPGRAARRRLSTVRPALPGLTTQAPFEVWLGFDAKARLPKVDYPPLRIVRFSGPALIEGVEKHAIRGVTVRVTGPARTVVDCFKYRNKVLEALA